MDCCIYILQVSIYFIFTFISLKILSKCCCRNRISVWDDERALEMDSENIHERKTILKWSEQQWALKKLASKNNYPKKNVFKNWNTITKHCDKF